MTSTDPRLETDFAETCGPGAELADLAVDAEVVAVLLVVLLLLPQPATMSAATGRISTAVGFLTTAAHLLVVGRLLLSHPSV
ncbi:MAG: hypothetical protein WB507_14700 [Solirubrobacterales bacterium]